MGRVPAEEVITVACITDCATVTVHTGKCYKALINLGATISLLRYSTYKKIRLLQDPHTTHHNQIEHSR